MDINYLNEPNYIVGIGASAGGLEALEQLLTFLPNNTGMAFVIIQHLAPNHKSLLTQILSKYTSMPVIEAVNGMKVQRNHLYMIPPRYNIEINQGILKLNEYDHSKMNHPIDIFFKSLARSYQNKAIAVILSGTGSDGTNGIRSIKDQNGVIIVQSPESAKFDGMPKSAIATGLVDIVQSPDQIAKEMTHISSSVIKATNTLETSDGDLMIRIFNILKKVTNVDYAYYKKTTILRRIERRMVITHNKRLSDYVQYLASNDDEAKILAKEVLIGVTCFFRDPEYFETLKQKVVIPLVEKKGSKQIRVWVAGCSTGEEAYSIAILFEEAMDELGVKRDVKIFATDLDSDAVATASAGVYSDSIIEDVSISRLSRFFTKKNNKYVIRHHIRNMIVFAQHNVFGDPPFGKLDLISCRNLLIYFQMELQRKLFSIFHVALNDEGYLFLGRSESVFDYDDLFKVIASNEKIFIHNTTGREPIHPQLDYSFTTIENSLRYNYMMEAEDRKEEKKQEKEMDTSIFESLIPESIVVNDKNELCRVFGDCHPYISIPHGYVTLDVFSLVTDELKTAVSTILRESRLVNKRISYDKVPVTIDDQKEYITVVAQPIYDRRRQDMHMTAISFIRGHQYIDDTVHFDIDHAADQRITNLETELQAAKDDLEKTVSELESVNAELQAANEELLTANEELQSSNEELQSVNEELYTVNSEYQSKVTELASVNDDMANFLSTTLVGVLMVDENLNIRKFTDYIATEFSIAQQDMGRSLRYISYNFVTVDLMQLCQEVLSTMTPIEKHCASIAGKTYLIRIAPYHAHQDDDSKVRKLQGLVLTFVDTTKQIDDQKQIEEISKALREAVRSGKEKDSFLSRMSHDMRTPLTAINGLTQLTLQDPHISNDVRSNMEKILVSGNYLVSMIEEILETSRINAGKVVSVPIPVKEDSLFDQIKVLLDQKIRRKSQQLKFKVDGCTNQYVMMDLNHVSRILINLLDNAMKFTPENGLISFESHVYYTTKNADHTYIIRDTGCGMSKAFQETMYMPFEQEGMNQNDSVSGTGLGLFICKNLVELLNGDIHCVSAPGEGTTFTLHFKFHYAGEVELENLHKEDNLIDDSILEGKHILVAEDNEFNSEVIQKILSMKHITSDLVSDGKSALDSFTSHESGYYDAIILDLMMPIMDGFTTSVSIRDNDHKDAQTIPIIALTADVQPDTQEACLKSGMDAYLQKPIVSNLLFKTLEHFFKDKTGS